MSNNIELVEKLVEKTGISYTEAKAVLEKTDWDILEAIIQLEKDGRISSGSTAQYSTKDGGRSEDTGKSDAKGSGAEEKQKSNKSSTAEDFKKTSISFGQWVSRVISKGNSNSLVMSRNGEEKLSVPVTAFVLLLIFCFWIVIPLMIVSLFLGCSFSFRGKELGKEKVNEAMGKATNIAEGIKNEFKTAGNESGQDA